MATYEIWEGRMETLEKRLNTIMNKCRKHGLDFTYEVTGEVFRDVKDDKGEFHKMRYVVLEVEGKAVINGWEWLASIERTDKGNLIHSAKDVKVPTKYYTSDCYCEHCKKNVWRKYVYLVRNTKTGAIKQVGKSCLQEYTHGFSAEAVAAYNSLFTGLEEEEGWEPSGGYGFFGKVEYYDVEEITRFMSETIRHFGFVPRGENGEHEAYRMSTATRAEDFFNCANNRRSYFTGFYGFDQKRFDEIKATMEKVGFNANSPEAVKEAHDALEWIKEQDDSNSSYLHNLKLVCGMGEIRTFHYGILASLIPTWNKSLVREAERKARAAAEQHSKHVGNEGERITFEVASTRVVTSWETDYGTMWLVKFVSVDGNVFMWKASTLRALPDDFELIKTVTGTVKGHDEFRGIKQTFINRCKVTERTVEKPEPAHPAYTGEAEKALDQFFAAVQ